MEMTMRWPEDAPIPHHGQFFTVRVSEGPSPLLRRPFAFSGFSIDTSGGSRILTTRTIYQKRGPATQAMSGMSAGESLDILAPLGTAFPDPFEAHSSREDSQSRPVLIAGGVGVGPMLYLAESLRAADPLLVIGARNKTLLPLSCLPDTIETILCTDDGSYGCAGTVIDALQQRRATDCSTVYACGPNPMLAAAHNWAADMKLPCFVSMEQTMGCAVGACMGCVVPVHGPQPYARVCIEGPVFSSDLIDWEGLAHG